MGHVKYFPIFILALFAIPTLIMILLGPKGQARLAKYLWPDSNQ
jgi:hypothetical protein